jgi:hypothetical protein
MGNVQHACCMCTIKQHSLAPMSVSIIAATSPVLSLPALQKNSTGRPASADSAGAHSATHALNGRASIPCWQLCRRQAALSCSCQQRPTSLTAGIKLGGVTEPRTAQQPDIRQLPMLLRRLTADVPQCCSKPWPAVFKQDAIQPL